TNPVGELLKPIGQVKVEQVASPDASQSAPESPASPPDLVAVSIEESEKAETVPTVVPEKTTPMAEPTIAHEKATPSIAAINAPKIDKITIPQMVHTEELELEEQVQVCSACHTMTGEQIYKRVCTSCHAMGIVGAPKLGEQSSWAPRIAKGMDTLFINALQGFRGEMGIMPPRGGQGNLLDEEVKAAVTYMVDAVSPPDANALFQ
ncbi:MAG: hypothetical protein DRQ41_11335, partial [Gammaproteobacteria bacterium]